MDVTKLIFENVPYKALTDNDILICAFGYESRSLYLYEKNKKTRNSNNTLVFQNEETRLSKDIEKRGIQVVPCHYNEPEKCIREIELFIKKRENEDSELSIHVDYSFMPRSWYCSLPPHMFKAYSNSKKYFWYTAGEYPHFKLNYPSAGIDDISVFAGTALPAIDEKRFHVMGLGFDSIRTETVKSIVEPDSLIACYAYNPENPKIEKQVCELNKATIENALISVALPINNFSGMIQKISDIIYDQLQSNSQVIIIPDGPKPLILAMSLIPFVVAQPGITCLHISHNSAHYNKINVKPRENEIYGFTMH